VQGRDRACFPAFCLAFEVSEVFWHFPLVKFCKLHLDSNGEGDVVENQLAAACIAALELCGAAQSHP
jgi:hypothetical protein